MTFLPIVERELRVASRRRATYWVRLAIALVGLGIGAIIFVVTLGFPATLIGRVTFESLAGLLMLYCLAYGRRSTADCLSQERREGTLGLLFLTDLKGHDIVLGKLVATSLNGFYGLLAVFPILAVPMLMGGITNGEFWRMLLVLVNTFLFSLAVGMLGSALSRDFKQAMAANFLLLLLFIALPPACLGIIQYTANLFVPELLYSCPAYAFYLCSYAHYLVAKEQFWSSVAVTHGLSWALVWFASRLVPRSWQDQPVRKERRGWRALWRQWSYGHPTHEGKFRKQLLDVNAFYWLAARARRKPVHVWTFLACMVAWWLVGWLSSGRLWMDYSVAVLTAILLNSTLKVWIAIEAGQQLAEDQKTGGFELLLSTPLTVHDIVRGQWLALYRQFLKPLLAVLGLEVLLLVIWMLPMPDPEAVPVWLAGMGMLVADLIALGWVGMSRALIARSHNAATISTLLRVLILPWAAFGAVLASGHVWYGVGLGKTWSPSWQLLLGLWVGFGLVADLGFGLLAWGQLHYHFRQLALRRFNPKAAPVPEPKAKTEALKPASGHPTPSSPKMLPMFRPATVLMCGFVSLILGGGLFVVWPRAHYPPPLVVPMTQGPGSLRVFPGPGGAFFILPDGSLWRWGLAGNATDRAALPQQIGTNHNWMEAAATPNRALALRSDGTIWEWGARFGGQVPHQVDPGRDWVSIAGSANHAVALRRDGALWAWGETFMNTFGARSMIVTNRSTNLTGTFRIPRPASPTFTTNLVQVGTNNDWAAVSCSWASTMAIRRDGTLWVWGSVFVLANGIGAPNRLAAPTPVCLETNWTGFSSGLLPLVGNRSGELWELFYGAPGPDLPVAAVGRLVSSNALPGRVVTAYTGVPKLYQLRPDGTLWEQAYTYGVQRPSGPAEPWRQLGKRTDWVSLWGGNGTAYGLTKDGTLWSWGLDPSVEPTADLLTRLKNAQSQLQGALGPRPGPRGVGASQPVQKQPRPLMRLAH